MAILNLTDQLARAHSRNGTAMSDSSKTAACLVVHNRRVANSLTTIPNVGPAVARRLAQLGIAVPDDLRGRDPQELFERLCRLDGRAHDPCLLDTFVAAVSYVEGGEARPWWEFSRERKAGTAR